MKNKLLAIDYHFQVVAFSLLAMASLTFFGLMLLVPFGAYQVLSAGAKGVFLDSYRHRIFALVAGLYGSAIMYVAIEGHHGLLQDVLALFPDPFLQMMAIFAYILVPFTSAIYYLRQSRMDYEATKESVSEEWV